LQLVAYVPEGACRKAPQHFFQFLACPEKTFIDRLERNFQQVEVTNKVVIFFKNNFKLKKLKLLCFTQSRTFQIFYPQGRPLVYQPWGISHPEGSKPRPFLYT